MMQKNTETLKISRRKVVATAAWSAPAVIVSSNVPVYAASNGVNVPNDFSIEVADPKIDWDTLEYVADTPIYAGKTGKKAIGKGALPQTFTITNLGSSVAENPHGTLQLQMRDNETDIPSVGGADKTRANSGDPRVIISPAGLDEHGGGLYTWIYNGSIEPGGSAEIPLRYYVNYPFANVDYELLVTASVIDQSSQDSNDTDVKMGTVKGFARYW